MINLTWWNGLQSRNWGDGLNPVLAEKISKEKVKWIDYRDTSDTFRYYSIGSILQSLSTTNCIVWGTGFSSINSKIRHVPKEIRAVRGPLTRDSLLRAGIKCPEVYGDPALLYPRYYNPVIEKKYKLGIIPHYIDKNNPWLEQFKGNKDILIIDILGGINKFVDEIKSCNLIVSSSLHGIIAGDSYGIPSMWIELSDGVLGKGFKFRDYFMSVGRAEREPIIVSIDTPISKIFDSFQDYKIDIDLDLLYDVCPFKK